MNDLDRALELFLADCLRYWAQCEEADGTSAT